MAYISATTEFQQIIFILKFKHYHRADECFSVIKMGGDFSPDLPFKHLFCALNKCTIAI